MFENLKFTEIEGTINSPPLTLMALSTCGFCRKAQGFLEDRGWAYRYIHLDLLEPEDKNGAKVEFQKKFEKILSYPTLIIGNEQFIIGFIREVWEEKLKEIHEKS